MPKYVTEENHRSPRVRLEEKIDMLIASASKKCALIYAIVKECGLRPVEVACLPPNAALTWKKVV